MYSYHVRVKALIAVVHPQSFTVPNTDSQLDRCDVSVDIRPGNLNSDKSSNPGLQENPQHSASGCNFR